MNICYIKKTGQSVSGELKYEGIWYDGGWRLDDKGKKHWEHGKYVYIPIFKCCHPAKQFAGYSEIIVNDKIEFTAYCGSAVCGIYSLIGKDPVDELQIGEN